MQFFRVWLHPQLSMDFKKSMFALVIFFHNVHRKCLSNNPGFKSQNCIPALPAAETPGLAPGKSMKSGLIAFPTIGISAQAPGLVFTRKCEAGRAL